jgi:hypothetical protein
MDGTVLFETTAAARSGNVRRLVRFAGGGKKATATGEPYEPARGAGGYFYLRGMYPATTFAQSVPETETFQLWQLKQRRKPKSLNSSTASTKWPEICGGAGIRKPRNSSRNFPRAAGRISITTPSPSCASCPNTNSACGSRSPAMRDRVRNVYSSQFRCYLGQKDTWGSKHAANLRRTSRGLFLRRVRLPRNPAHRRRRSRRARRRSCQGRQRSRI